MNKTNDSETKVILLFFEIRKLDRKPISTKYKKIFLLSKDINKLKKISSSIIRDLKISKVSSNLQNSGKDTIKDPFKKNFIEFIEEGLSSMKLQSSLPKWYAAKIKNIVKTIDEKRNQIKAIKTAIKVYIK